MANNYDIDYNDKRFSNVEADKQEALSDVEKTYGGMINSSDEYYNAQIDATRDYAETQKQNQQAQTDFAIQEINQQKEQAHKDYIKEQSGSYLDYQRAINPYGVNAEQMAANGLANSGYSESAQTAMYVAYQQRVAAARESYQLAVQNYNNAITEARLQNNSVLAEIAFNALQKELELSLAGFQYKNQLILEKTNQKQNVENMYYNRYQDVLAQINHENALAEEVRQYNESMAEEKRQYNESMAFQKEQFAWQKAQAAKSSSGGGSSIKKSSGSSSKKSKSSHTSSKSSINKGAKNQTIKNSQSKSSEPTVDMSSVLALGYGPISASKLNQLVSEGKAVEYEENGKLKYRKAFNY